MLPHFFNDETAAVVRLIANIFVVMTSLVFGLMMNSSKNTYEAIDNNLHSFATNIIVIDKTMRNYGSETADAREKLRQYVDEAIRNPTWGTPHPETNPDIAGKMLDALGKSIATIKPGNDYATSTLSDIRQQYYQMEKQRWLLIEQSGDSIPFPVIIMLTAWLVLIFASYGYRAPQNAVTISMVIISAFLISGSLYLVLDMNAPFSGPIHISNTPLQRALFEIKL